MRKLTTQEFIDKAKAVHGGKYDYSKTEYVNTRTKVEIICPVHGSFWQSPYSHLNGCGCTKCGGKEKKRKSDFIEQSRAVHGDRYDYSKVEYVNNSTKVCIICPEHGEFWQTPSDHLNGHGCPKCGGTKHLTRDEFIEKARQVHGDKYDYSKVEYVNYLSNVCIICPKHGEFQQVASSHLRGRGCPECGKNKYAETKRLTTEEFIKRSDITHNGLYDYYATGCGCQKCSVQKSSGEEEIFEFLRQNTDYDVLSRRKTVIPPYEVDIFIPQRKLAIEYDGLLWHSEKYKKDSEYHLHKTEMCERQGIRLIHIFEDEWNDHKDIVKSKILSLLGDNKQPKVYARNCAVKPITNKEGQKFLTNNNIQGYGSGSIYLGCFDKEKLVAVMSFKKENNQSDSWELTRFASDINLHCVGVGSKMFKYFVINYNPSEVKSFADRRWSTNCDNLYVKIGFTLDEITKPDYCYINNKGKTIHKFNCRKQVLHKKYGFPLTMKEREMADKLGLYRLWNCGLLRYKWLKQSP